ncbi:MAG TPA: cyclase family protein [Anaerolineales bacterium]|nr:cyclase family protein [Anaerolineales bacterium]
MRIYDISVGIRPDMPVWPGDPPVSLERVGAIAQGRNANVSHLSCGVHIGTHVDAPLHFLDGAGGVETMSLESLTGRAYVVDLRKAVVIDADTLHAAHIPTRAQRLLFRTRNSDYWKRGERTFQKEFVAIDETGAEWLVHRKVRLVGVDYLSVAPFGRSRPTHEILLKANMAVVEGLDLNGVPSGAFDLYCLPLKLIGSDGAPARAILIRA